jgi:hypothetical protein
MINECMSYTKHIFDEALPLDGPVWTEAMAYARRNHTYEVRWLHKEIDRLRKVVSNPSNSTRQAKRAEAKKDLEALRLRLDTLESPMVWMTRARKAGARYNRHYETLVYPAST